MSEPTMASQGFRHFGIFRTGVTTSQGLEDKFIVRVLFRRGEMGEGELANKVNDMKDNETFKASLARMVEWKIIEILPAGWGNAKKVRLTPAGQYWGEELCCEMQKAGQDSTGPEV
jgi:hypothetical protein